MLTEEPYVHTVTQMLPLKHSEQMYNPRPKRGNVPMTLNSIKIPCGMSQITITTVYTRIKLYFKTSQNWRVNRAPV